MFAQAFPCEAGEMINKMERETITLYFIVTGDNETLP
jgi:hypothetical protein